MIRIISTAMLFAAILAASGQEFPDIDSSGVDIQSDSGTISSIEYDTGPSRSATRVLIMRPVSSFGAERLENKWLLILCEAYFHFRFTGIPGIEIINPELLSRAIPEYKEFRTAVPIDVYRNAAKSLLAPYMLYIECGYAPLARGGQITIGQELQLTVQLTGVDDGRDILTVSKLTGLKKLGQTFDRFIAQTLDSIGVPPERRNTQFLKQEIFSRRARPFRKLGADLEACLNADSSAWETALKTYRLSLNNYPDMAAGYFAGMQVCARRNDYIAAAHFAQDLILEFGNGFAPAYVNAVRYYRLAHDCQAARKMSEEAPDLGFLKEDIQRELSECAGNDNGQNSESGN